MPKNTEVIPLTPQLCETVFAAFPAGPERDFARRIVRMFTEGGYPVKIKKYRGASMQGTCRILCFLQKSGEAVILNNRGMGRDGASIQVRIADQSLFHKLDGLSENLKSRILHAGDCGFCSPKCEGKRYVFSYGEKDYVKCRYLCSNFLFDNLKERDMDELAAIIAHEIAQKQAGNASPSSQTKPK